MSYSAPAGAPPVRRSRWPRRLLITLLVLVVVVVALDRGGDYVAEQVAATSIARSQHLDHDPDVDIGGVPFLTQLATRHFDDVTITADQVPVRDVLKIDRLRVVLQDLTISRDFHEFHAATANAVGTVGYAELSRIFGVQLSYAGNGRVRFSVDLPVVGRQSVTAAPEFTNGALAFGAGRLNDGRELGAIVTQALSRFFGVTVPLQNIPFQISVRRLSVDGSGLRIELVGNDLSYRRDAAGGVGGLAPTWLTARDAVATA